MTEIPEHLLNRSKARRADASGDSTGDSTPAVATPAASTAPAKAKEAPAPKAVVPDPAYVVAAKTRKKIPFWAMTTLALLPAWAMLYLIALKPAEKVIAGPMSVGAATYGSCAGCHGAAGAGGAGRVLYQGEVMKTFPHIEDMLNFVYTGSQKYVAAGLKLYGNPKREGGAHAPLSYNGNAMPMQGEKAGGALTEAEILSVVCHVRYTTSGTDTASEEWMSEYETWCKRNRSVHIRSTIGEKGLNLMARTDANPPMPEWSTEYQLVEVDADYLGKAVKPKQFIHIDQSECIMCEGCVDICPWKCIHMVTPDAIAEAHDTEMPGLDPSDNVLFIIDDDVCTRCALCVDRCPTGVIIMGKVGAPDPDGDSHIRTNNHGYGYGMRL